MKTSSLILAALLATAGVVNAAEPAKAPAKAEKKVEKKEVAKKAPPSDKKPTPKKKAEPK